MGCLRSAAVAFLCQTCGADPRGSWGSNVPRGDVAEGTCPDCGRSLTPPFARATLNDDDPAVEYEFDDWDAEDRAAAAEALTAKIIPFRWEPGLILAVAAHREGDADAVLDELEDAADVQGGALPEATEGWGEGEDAFAALGNLFDAADRLFHTPTGTTAANDLRERHIDRLHALRVTREVSCQKTQELSQDRILPFGRHGARQQDGVVVAIPAPGWSQQLMPLR